MKIVKTVVVNRIRLYRTKSAYR